MVAARPQAPQRWVITRSVKCVSRTCLQSTPYHCHGRLDCCDMRRKAGPCPGGGVLVRNHVREWTDLDEVPNRGPFRTWESHPREVHSVHYHANALSPSWAVKCQEIAGIDGWGAEVQHRIIRDYTVDQLRRSISKHWGGWLGCFGPVRGVLPSNLDFPAGSGVLWCPIAKAWHFGPLNSSLDLPLLPLHLWAISTTVQRSFLSVLGHCLAPRH